MMSVVVAISGKVTAKMRYGADLPSTVATILSVSTLATCQQAPVVTLLCPPRLETWTMVC